VAANDIHFSGHNNEFVHFETWFQGQDGEDTFVIQSHGTQDDPQGLLIDSITIHDWIV